MANLISVIIKFIIIIIIIIINVIIVNIISLVIKYNMNILMNYNCIH